MISKLDIAPRTRILVGLLGSAAWLAAAGPVAEQDAAPHTAPAAEVAAPDVHAADQAEPQGDGNDGASHRIRYSLTGPLNLQHQTVSSLHSILPHDKCRFPNQNPTEGLPPLPKKSNPPPHPTNAPTEPGPPLFRS